MTEKLLLPVRVPELGPALGRLPNRPDPAEQDPLAPIRLRLVTRLLDAAGEARRRAAQGDRRGALDATGAPIWLAAWDEATSAVADALLTGVTTGVDEAARASRIPNRRRRRLLPSEEERRGIATRLGVTGAGLVSALDRLTIATEAAAHATARDRQAMDNWREALLGAARRLESAWERLVEEYHRERATWDREMSAARSWRAPWWPVMTIGAAVIAAATWIGLITGGYLTPPDWFVRIWQAVVR
jgi:hypothetical protein